MAYDDSMLCQITNPALSALSRDIYAYGSHVVQLLLREIQSPGSATSELPHADSSTAASTASAELSCSRPRTGSGAGDIRSFAIMRQ